MRANRIVTALLPVLSSLAIGACSFDIDKWFERNDPAVEQARRAILEAGPEAVGSWAAYFDSLTLFSRAR